MRTLLRLVPAALVLTLAFVAYASTPLYCTQEAKLCPDGSYVGRDSNNNCEFAPCPDACSKEECGPAMGMPNYLCSDGSVGGPVCSRNADGTCGYHVRQCPEQKDDCSPYVCADGTQIPRCSEDGHVINYFAAPCMTHGGEDGPFEDVPANHENADAIFYVKAQGIVEGYADGTYKPDASINRAEFVKILYGSYFADPGGISACSQIDLMSDDWRKEHLFSDVSGGAWYATPVCESKVNGYIEGYPDGAFRPANPINFVEAAKILVKAFGLEASSTIPACEGECPWYRDYVLMLEMRAAIPTTITSFDARITRGEMAEMIYRLRTGNNDKQSKTYEELSMRADVEYDVRYNYVLNPSTDDPYDGAIIVRDRRTGKETVLVPSVKDALPELKEYDNLSLRTFAQFDDSNVVIFKSVLLDTDNSSGDLYAFNTSTKTFSKMKLSDVFSGFYDGSASSPDGKRLVWTVQKDVDKANLGLVQSLYVGSLVDDSYSEIVHLQGDETFNGGQFALSSIFDISWTDDHTVRYAVYSQKDKYGDPIAYRTVRIP